MTADWSDPQSRRSDGSDTMHGPLGSNACGHARVHGVHLGDPGSCDLPRPAETITLEEWRAQQGSAE